MSTDPLHAYREARNKLIEHFRAELANNTPAHAANLTQEAKDAARWRFALQHAEFSSEGDDPTPALRIVIRIPDYDFDANDEQSEAQFYAEVEREIDRAMDAHLCMEYTAEDALGKNEDSVLIGPKR